MATNAKKEPANKATTKGKKQVSKPAKESTKKVDIAKDEPKKNSAPQKVEEPIKQHFDFEARKKDLEGLCQKFNEATIGKDYDEINRLNPLIDEALNEYNTAEMNKCFAACKKTKDPMLEAVKRLTFPIIGIKDTKDNDTGIVTRDVVDKIKQIDLLRLHRYCGGIGKDVNWVYMAEKFNFLLTVRLAESLDVEPEQLKLINSSYLMKEISKSVIFYEKSKDGKSAPAPNPVSNRSIMKTLNSIIMAMIGPDFKANSHDLNWLMSVYARQSSKNIMNVTAASHSRMRGYLAVICHHLVKGEHYGVEFKEIKK